MENEAPNDRQREAALLASQERYERLVNTLPVMLYDSFIDATGTSRFLYVAPGPCRALLELDPDALLADMNLAWQLVHPEDIERFHQADLAANRAGREFSTEVRIITPSGRLKWLLVHSRPNPAPAGETVIWSGYLQDITARKQAVERLRETEQRLRLVVENSTNLFYIHTPDQLLTYVSPQSREFFDCEPAEAMVRWTDLITDHPLNQAGVAATQRAIETGVRQPPYSLECIGKKGRKIWVEVNETPIIEGGRTVAIAGTLTDITERRQAEKEREEYFRFFQTSTDLMCMADPDGYFLKINPAFTATLGYSAAEIAAKPILEFVHPDDRQATVEEIRRQQQAGFTDNFENRYYCKDGSVKWLSWRVTYDKTAGLAFATARDITEEQAAKATLRANEERMALALQAGNMGLYDLNLQTGEAVVNPGYALMLGYDPATFHETNARWTARLHPDDRDAVIATFRNYLRGKLPQYKVEFRQRTRDGGWKWILSLGKIMARDHQGKALRMLGVHVDIDDRKKTEAALRESEFFFRESQRAAAIGSYKADLVARYWQSSEVLDAIFGIGPDYERSIEGWLALVHPEDRDSLARYLQEEVIGQRKPFNREYRIIRNNDGVIRWVSGRGALRAEKEGQELYLRGTIQDITEQVQREEEKDKLEAQLGQIQKIESVGRLAGGVAHDFNNMLSVILGHVEMARKKETISPTLQGHLEQIQRAATRSADIVRQLLAFARKQTVAPEVLDLNATVNNALKMIGRLIGEEIELRWLPGPDLWPIRIDPSQIDQILTNLCINARDAINGIGRITLATGSFSCDELFSHHHTGLVPGDYVLLTVSDDGCGMNAETRAKIFEPFFTSKGVGEGTGLGLATVYGIVKQNDGFIDVYSEPGQGTSFKIYLPRYQGEEVPAGAAEVTEAIEGGKETVLLVEDEPDILDVGTQMLELQGYRVLAAATPGEAIRLAQEHRGEIHLLMTDVVMPEMNGRELAEKLQARYPGLRCLFMSGYTADIITHRGVLDEGVQFIQKPFTLKALGAKVREVLGA
ncbi:hypothetical protein JCM30471_29030 [Desulfuromonas carbonis]|uniref:hybrid sensor histidine kinase/response regulator n=1 Tax=Desulfuromonas sp. DDH964 TaxID=1823759 RepID=UPI00078E532E|nr:PAS domain S-box protein [Desulfuromonas sp. DDH964]AMV71084.1 sensor histidine kinase response regulator, PAS, GAF and PAS domain-containing [Desulfuromonas sp. DDH964]